MRTKMHYCGLGLRIVLKFVSLTVAKRKTWLDLFQPFFVLLQLAKQLNLL